MVVEIVFLIASAKVRVDTLAFLARAISTTGKVIRIEEDSISNDEDRSTFYYPVIEFTNSKRNPIQFKSNIGSSFPAFKIGQQVKVLYNPQNLSSAKIATFIQVWLGAIILGVIGIGSTMVGIVLIFKKS